jgi:hypothetical protein
MLTAFGGIFIFANKLLTELFKNLIFTFGNDEIMKLGDSGGKDIHDTSNDK